MAPNTLGADCKTLKLETGLSYDCCGRCHGEVGYTIRCTGTLREVWFQNRLYMLCHKGHREALDRGGTYALVQ